MSGVAFPALALTACGSGTAAPTVPSLPGSASGSSLSQAQQLQLAGQCIRQHGIPGFPDPAPDSSGAPTINKQALLTAPSAVVTQALAACRTALDRAGLQLGHVHDPHSAPSPQQLQALLAYARCIRAHGEPNFPDPDPSNGQISLPPGVSKLSAGFVAAQQACHSKLPGGS